MARRIVCLARRIVRYPTTADALFPAVSTVARQRPVEICRHITKGDTVHRYAQLVRDALAHWQPMNVTEVRQ